MSVQIPEFVDVGGLEAHLSEPGVDLVSDIARVPGDILVLGAGGKMGPTLAIMARKALDRAGSQDRVIAVARFTDPAVRDRLESLGVETITCDLLDADAVSSLPDVPNVIFMAGMKFGTSGNPAMTWAMNALVPSIVAGRFSGSRMVVFSSGNIYPMVPVDSGGATEETPLSPVGEYAQSILARERMFDYFSARDDTPILLLRLNYAVEPRYGIPVDLCGKILDDEPIDLDMGYVNLIWQRDANEIALRCLTRVSTPSTVLNVTGTGILSIRDIAEGLGNRLDRKPVFMGHEKEDALLSNASLCSEWFGPPATSIEAMMDSLVSWRRDGGLILGKPTRFQVRDGQF